MDSYREGIEWWINWPRIVLNYQLFQKLKLIGNDECNHLINSLTLSPRVVSNSPSISEAQHVEYLIEMRGKL
jgi:hypothetical protein